MDETKCILRPMKACGTMIFEGVDGTGRHVIARCHTDGDGHYALPIQEAREYARLFAAAPDMLAALKACKETLDSERLHIDGLNEAIAKAEGRAE